MPGLLVEARKAHIVPGLAYTSLVSIKMEKGAVKVFYKNKVV